MRCISRIVTICLITMFCWPLFSFAAQKCKIENYHAPPSYAFILNNDGTITHNATGLMWMRCSMGQKWEGKSCSGTASGYSWPDALQVASKFKFAGYEDWRLPNKNELESIVDERCFGPAVNSEIFPDTPSAYFWSSSTYTGLSHGAWSVDFGYGNVNASVKTGSIHVRLVRDESSRGD